MARLLPKDMALFPPACIWRMKKTQKRMMRRIGNQLMRMENEGAPGGVLDDDVDLVVAEDLDQVVVSRGQDGLEGLAVRELAAELVLLDRDLFDLALLDLGHELGEGDVLLGHGRATGGGSRGG